jgi:hypothetical protein
LASVGAETISKAIKKRLVTKTVLLGKPSYNLRCATARCNGPSLNTYINLYKDGILIDLITTIEALFTNLPKYALVALPSIIHFKKKLGFLIKLLSKQKNFA